MDSDGPESLAELKMYKHHWCGAKNTTTLDYADLGGMPHTTRQRTESDV